MLNAEFSTYTVMNLKTKEASDRSERNFAWTDQVFWWNNVEVTDKSV